MDNNYSLADLAAATGGEQGFLGGNGSGALIILFLIIAMMGGGFNGFGNNATNAVSQADLQRAIDLSAIQTGQAGISADIQRGIYEINSSTKDAAYNNLSEIRDVQAATSNGFFNTQAQIQTAMNSLQSCCCETKQSILESRYLAAQNEAATQAALAQQAATLAAAVHSEGETTRAMLQQDKIENLQGQINALQLQNAVAGVVRYPMASTYCSGSNPYCTGASY